MAKAVVVVPVSCHAICQRSCWPSLQRTHSWVEVSPELSFSLSCMLQEGGNVCRECRMMGLAVQQQPGLSPLCCGTVLLALLSEKQCCQPVSLLSLLFEMTIASLCLYCTSTAHAVPGISMLGACPQQAPPHFTCIPTLSPYAANERCHLHSLH